MAVSGHPLGFRTEIFQTLRYQPSKLILQAKEALFLNKSVQSTSLPCFSPTCTACTLLTMSATLITGATGKQGG